MAMAKEQIRQIISENNIDSVADVYALLKDSFKDILQELMEAELDASLGYTKNQKGGLETDNKRNGHSAKNLKSQYGEFQIEVPRDRNGEFEPRLIPKYQFTSDELFSFVQLICVDFADYAMRISKNEYSIADNKNNQIEDGEDNE